MSAIAATHYGPEAANERVPAIAVRGVSHSYGSRKVLQNVNLTVPASRFSALRGLNGAGKTTLFSLITRL